MIGQVIPYVGVSAPEGWLLCNGQAVSRTTYSELFAAIGTTYGAGDGSTTFNVPNMTSRFVRGSTSGGATGGADTHVHGGLGTDGAHSHYQEVSGTPNSFVNTYNFDKFAKSAHEAHTHSFSNITSGGGHGHSINAADNKPSYIELFHIVRAN